MGETRSKGCLRSLDLEKFKYCWISVVEAGGTPQNVFESTFEKEYKEFKLRPLTVSYRSSHHISEFVSNFIESELPESKCQTSVSGCFTSSQLHFKKNFFQKLEENFIKRDEDFLDKKFDQNRFLIILTSSEDVAPSLVEHMMEEFSCQKVATKTGWPKCIGINKKDPSEFTGCEAQSVVIVLDSDNLTQLAFQPVILAISRAQYEVALLVKETLRKDRLWIQNMEEKNEEKVRFVVLKKILKREELDKDTFGFR